MVRTQQMIADPLFVKRWRPNLRLTRKEIEIVKLVNGMTTVLGRSGTGKTFCICGRMDYDADRCSAYPGNKLRQIFLAGTRNVVDQARRLRAHSRPGDDRAVYKTMGQLMLVLHRRFNPDNIFDPTTYLSWTEFKENFWSGVNTKRRKQSKRTKRSRRVSLFPLTVWTEIRSCIKGSYHLCRPRSRTSGSSSRSRLGDSSSSARHACHVGGCLTRQEYMHLGKQECRLSEKQRSEVYNIFEEYERYNSIFELFD